MPMTERVLISGGSGGIGRALCAGIAQAGYQPVIGYSSNSTAAEEIAAETEGSALHLDLTSSASIAGAVDALAESDAPLAGVILAASPPPAIAPVFRLPDDELDIQWQVNVRGPHALLNGVVRRLMRPRKAGWVAAILTQAMGREDVAAKSMGGYIIAKYGLLGFLKVLEAEYTWLQTHEISPGYTETEMLKAFDERFLDQVRAAQTEGRFASPEEVAGTLLAKVLET